jgi:hypothetical protein
LSEPFWRLERFGDQLEHWIDQEQPAPELRKAVIDWTFALFDNPYAAGLRRDRATQLLLGRHSRHHPW